MASNPNRRISDADWTRINNQLRALPERWPENQRELKIKLTVSKDAAVRITSRIYQDIDRDLISAEFNVKKSPHSVEMEILIRVAEVFAIAALHLLLDEVKQRAINAWRRRREE